MTTLFLNIKIKLISHFVVVSIKNVCINSVVAAYKSHKVNKLTATQSNSIYSVILSKH